MPDPIIESDLGLQESVAFKINEIQRIIGEDYKILSEDEQINENDIYVIYDEDDSIFDKEDINLLEPSKFEKILKNIQINDPEYWEEFKKIPDGIRSSKENTIGGSLLLACESDSTKSANIRKYYLLDPSKNIKELTSKQTLRILESEDKTTHGAPSNYTELVSIGWKKFLEEFRKKIKNAGETKYKISAFDIDLLKKDIKNDIETFNQIYKLIDKVTHITDDKLIQLQKLLDEEYKNKKILVFTEFTSTAQYLSDNLKWKGKKVQVDSSRNNALDAARKFDPENNPSDNDDKIEKNDEISLLISTDVLSEGVNLQAGH